MAGAGSEAAPSAPGVVRIIAIRALQRGPYQPRRSMDEGELAALAASIREHGVLQPIVVRPSKSGFELVAGERRWRAALAAGLAGIPAVVRELSDRDAAVLAMVENLQREDLQFFEEAEGYQQLLEEFRLTQEQLAAEVGRSQPAIANKLRLLRLEPAVRAQIAQSALTERHARALLRLGTEGERLDAVKEFSGKRLTVQQAERWVDQRLGPVAGPARRAPRGVVRDLRIYFNAVREVADGLRAAGFPTEVSQEEDGDGWTVSLRISRRSASAAKRRRA